MANIFRVFHIFVIYFKSFKESEIRSKYMRNKKNMPYCTNASAITSLSHSYQNIGDHRSGKTKNAITFLSRININATILISTHLGPIFPHLTHLRSILVPDVLFLRFPILLWLICIKNVKLTSKHSKFN